MIVEVMDILISKIEGCKPMQVRECPHCEGEARLLLSSLGNYVECSKCGASGPRKENPIDAINAWNCRKEDKEQYVVKFTEADIKQFADQIKTETATEIQNCLDILDRIQFKGDSYIKKTGVVRILNGFKRGQRHEERD